VYQVVFLTLMIAFFVFFMSLLSDLMLEAMMSTSTKVAKYTVCDARVLALGGTLLIFTAMGTTWCMLYEEWGFIESIYFTVITMTTVGYGDFAPLTQTGRLVMSFYILLACGFFSAFMAGMVTGYVSARRRAAALRFMMTGLSEDQLNVMPRDEYGAVSRKDFVQFMVVTLGYISEEDMLLLHDCFDTMDYDGSGFLNVDDIIGNEEAEVWMERLRRKHGIRKGDAVKLPFGIFGLRLRFRNDPEEVDEASFQAAKEKAKAKDQEAVADNRLPQSEEEGSVEAVVEGFMPEPATARRW